MAIEDKELRRMSRIELIEIIYALQQNGRELQQRIDTLERQLDERRICVEQAGSIAEAALGLNKVFADAQAAAEQYLLSVQAMRDDADGEKERILEDARLEAQRIAEEAERRLQDAEMEAEQRRQEAGAEAEAILARAQEESERRRAQTEEGIDRMWEDFSQRMNSVLRNHASLTPVPEEKPSEQADEV